MEINKLYTGVLVFLLVAILMGVGLTVLGNMSSSVRQAAAYSDDNFTAVDNACTSLTYSTIDTSTASFENKSVLNSYSSSYFTWDSTEYNRGSCVTLTSAGVTAGLNNTQVNVSYTYGADTTAQDKLDSSITGIGGLVSWFAVIVVIIAAAIIIGIVTKGFSGRG